MIAKEDYKQMKEAVLELYGDKFLPLLKEIYTITNDKTICETRVKNLVSQAGKIKNDKFTLMVAGEAKSGKSTFINAYLGVDILPMDVLQCTSSIVEIRYDSETKLIATYADDRQKIIFNIEEIKEFLKKHAAVDDRYRELPVSIINEEILAKKQGKEPSKKDIDLLMSGISKERPSGISDDEYRAKVKDYIKEKQPTWNNIISKIEIAYPFKDESMKGITIVDSPGVGSEGHVGDVTHKYISNADAIFFLKSIQGQDLDNSSFKQFITNKSVARKKDLLFLALTRIANETEENVCRVREEAVRRFKSIIEREQIIAIDSKAQLFYNEIKDFSLEEIITIYNSRKEAGTLDNFIKVAWIDAGADRENFLKELKALSRFQLVNETLNKFARTAHYKQLTDFLSNIILTSREIVNILDSNIDLYKKSIIDSESLEEEIKQITNELESKQKRLNENIREIRAIYMNGNDSIVSQKANQVLENYQKGLELIDAKSDNRFQSLKELTSQQTLEFVKFQEQIMNEVVTKYDNEIIILNDKSSINKKINIPGITKEMVDEAIEVEADSPDSFTVLDVVEGKTFFKTEKKVPKFSEELYYTNVKNNILDRIQEIKSKLIKSLLDYVDATSTVYKRELIKNIRDQRIRLEKIKNDQRNNDNKIEHVNKLTAAVEKLDFVTVLLKDKKELVENHVKR